jgi:hypothetical protein
MPSSSSPSCFRPSKRNAELLDLITAKSGYAQATVINAALDNFFATYRTPEAIEAAARKYKVARIQERRNQRVFGKGGF